MTLEDRPGWTRVDVASVSICGSDLEMIEMGFAEGRVLGHEFSGTTPDGTRVTSEPIVACGGCQPCVDGNRYHCTTDGDIVGISYDGAMAESVMVPTSTLLELPSGLDLHDASICEPIAVAHHGLVRSGLRPGDRVGIIGAGSVGLATAAVLVDAGATVDIGARHPHQQDAAVSLGASVGLTDEPYDLIFDCVGSTATVNEAVERLRPLGRLVMLGVFWEPISMSLPILLKEIDLIPAMIYGGVGNDSSFHHAMRILSERPEIASTLITHRMDLDAAPEALELARDRASGVIKVALAVRPG